MSDHGWENKSSSFPSITLEHYIIALISSHTLPNDDLVELLTQFSHIMNDI